MSLRTGQAIKKTDTFIAVPEPEIHPALAEVIERLAKLERGAGSPGEAEAADWIAERLRAAGCEAEVEDVDYLDGYARPIGAMTGLSVLAGMLALGNRTRIWGGLLAATATIAIADDISNGFRFVRRLTRRRRTQNVVAVTGDREANRTLVVLAHHDAAPTGLIFDGRAQEFVGERFPGIIERIDTSLPLWWLVLAGPAMIALGSLSKRRQSQLVVGGTVFSSVATASFADIARSPIVPGANDNLSAVAVLVALAEQLRENPIHDLRVMLVSCGAEEVVQGGIHAFAREHFPKLNRDHTWMLNLETVGSPKLILLEGEGPVVMEDYSGKPFRDMVARVADRMGAPVRRGMRSRNSTDAVLPSRAGFPTATLASMNRYKALSNYHLMSDTPENVDYRTVAHALMLTEGVARELAANPWI